MLRSLALGLSLLSFPSQNPDSGLPASTQPVRPAAIERMAQQRHDLSTAVIEWIEQDAASGRLEFKTTQLAGDDIIRIRHGDESGVVIRSDSGVLGPENYKPQRTLKTGDQLWSYVDDSLVADLWSVASGRVGPPDLRSIGVVPWFSHDAVATAIDAERFARGERVEFTESTEGTIHRVIGRWGDQSIEWEIDAARGWNATRVAYRSGGVLESESRTTLARYGDVWFPERVDFFTSSFAGGQQPRESVMVLSAEFNRPELPHRLTPDDIGVEPGVNIYRYGPSGLPEGGVFFWDGRRVIDAEENLERMMSGELRIGDNVRRVAIELYTAQGDTAMVERLSRPQPTQPGKPDGAGTLLIRQVLSPWERYTADFIDRFRLNGEQAQKAWLICAGCQRRAKEWIDARSGILEEARQRAEAARQSASRPREKSADAIEAWMTDDALKPIRSIFEDELKPRLEKLPTRAQRRDEASRRSADKSPATAPATPAASRSTNENR